MQVVAVVVRCLFLLRVVRWYSLLIVVGVCCVYLLLLVFVFCCVLAMSVFDIVADVCRGCLMLLWCAAVS